MVVILAPSHCRASKVQDLAEMPSRWMTQAPHWEVSQPTWVPVSRKCSRRNCTSNIRGSILAAAVLPFTVIEIFATGTFLPIQLSHWRHLHLFGVGSSHDRGQFPIEQLQVTVAC